MLKKGVKGGRILIHPFSGAGVFFALTGIRRGAKRGGGVDVITAYIDWGRTRTIPFACIHCNQIDVDSSQTDLWCSAYSTYRFLSDANSNVGYTFRAIQNYKSKNHDLDLQAGSEIQLKKVNGVSSLQNYRGVHWNAYECNSYCGLQEG